MVAPIDAEAIPTPQLQASWLQTAAWRLRSDADRVRLAGVDIRADWQRLASVYRAPEAGQLLAVMDPVRTSSNTFADKVESAAAALERFADVAGPLASQLQRLQDDAYAFRRRLVSVEHWDHHKELVEENNGHLWAVDRAVVAFQAAERDCANAIEKLIGGTAFHAGGDPQTDPRAYGPASIPEDSATPWGAPAKTRKSCLTASLTAAVALNPGLDWGLTVDLFKGEFSAVTGMLEGLAAMTPALGWDRFERTWDGIATLDGLHGPSRAFEALTGMAKSTVDWDEWATDPGRAAGNAGVNVVSLAVPFAGEASALARVGRAGRAAELADEAARLSKAGATVEAAARAEEFARMAKLGEAADPELLGRMPRASDLDNALQQKFGDLSTAKSPVNSLEHEMVGHPAQGPEAIRHDSQATPRPPREETFAHEDASGSSRPHGRSSYADSADAAEQFQPPPTFIDRHQNLSNGVYSLDAKGMKPHIDGSTTSGKSQFLKSVDPDRLTLDAAAYADEAGLWEGSKAKVFVTNGPIGIRADTGELTSWVNVYRTKTGFVHATPGNMP